MGIGVNPYFPRAAKKPHEPNHYFTDATDAAGLIAPFAGKAGKYGLGPVSSVISRWNDPSPTNIAMTVIPLFVEEATVPLAVIGVAKDGSDFVANQVIIPVFTPDALQSDTIEDGNGILLPAPNAVFDSGQAFGPN
jgi:hypothetical protein